MRVGGEGIRHVVGILTFPKKNIQLPNPRDKMIIIDQITHVGASDGAQMPFKP